MKFTLIDMETWNRKEHFDCISKMDPSLINITANIDITSLKKFLSENSLKLYPCIIACISNVVNTHNEFKQAYNDKFQLGTYDIIHPSYTIFHKDDLTFSCIYSEYTKDIKKLYKIIENDMKQYANLKGYETRKAPKNSFPISCNPWVSYTGYSIIEQKEKLVFAPYIIIGKFIQADSKLLLPITFQISHSVADGFHIGRFYQELQKLVETFKTLYTGGEA